MFKLPLNLQSRSALTRKERKAFSHNISKFFKTESFEAFVDQNDLVISRNNYIGIPMKIYSSGAVALFIDSTGKGDWFPSIHLVQKCPDLAQSVQVKEDVDVLLKEGADLRWEDVKDLKGLGSFKKDDVRYVKSSDGQVIAIGAMACDSSEIEGETVMFILHVIGDYLWNFVSQCKEGTVFEEKVEKTKEGKKKIEDEEKKEPETDGRVKNKKEVAKKEASFIAKENGRVKEDEDQGRNEKKGGNKEDGEKIEGN